MFIRCRECPRSWFFGRLSEKWPFLYEIWPFPSEVWPISCPRFGRFPVQNPKFSKYHSENDVLDSLWHACQSYWRFEAPALVFSVVSASVLTVLVCFSRMCVDLLTRQGNRVYTVPLFCSVIPPNFVSTCIFAPITTHGLTLPNWLIMPSKCLSALIIKPTDPFLYLISVWNDHYHSNILMKQHRSRI